MSDVLVRLIAKEAGLRGLACVTTDLANEGTRRHETKPTSTVALGQALTGAALLGSALLKIKQRVSIKFDGDGALGKMIVDSDNFGRVRGYVEHNSADLPLIDGWYDVAGLIGAGSLQVVKDINLGHLLKSSVPISTGEIDRMIGRYLDQSEQIPNAIEIDVQLADDGTIAAAGGILIQAMPGYDNDMVEQFKTRLQALPPIAELLAAGKTPEQLLHQLFHDVEHEILEHRDLSFVCGCTLERSEQALITLGVGEIDALIEEGQALVDCHFCRQQYFFSVADLHEIRAMIDFPPPTPPEGRGA